MSQVLVMFWPNYWARLAGFVIMGATTLKNTTSYVWLFDLVEARHKQLVCGVMTGFDLTTITFLCLYFMNIDNNWYPLCFFMTILSAAAYVGAVALVPESPIWLLLQGKREEAIKALNWIAKMNGSENRIPDDATFEES